MATTSEYFDYLDQEIGIAPANSQEELQAAQLIEGLFRQHNLETHVQEFDASSSSGLLRGILQVLLLVGVLLSAVGSVSALGVLITLACAALLLADGFGYNLLSRVGGSARSQNVVAYHPATGDLVTKGSRRIVVLAHYDTPHENFLARPQFTAYQPIIKRVAFWAVPAVAVLSILQLFFGAATTGRRVVWLLALIATLPVVLVGVASIMERFAPSTEGANDNKASLAALLGIMDQVSPADIHLNIHPRPKKLEMADGSYGVRHGQEVLASLDMLPEDCEVIYDEFDLETEDGLSGDGEALEASFDERGFEELERKAVLIEPGEGENFELQSELGGAPDMSDPEDWHPSGSVGNPQLAHIPVIGAEDETEVEGQTSLQFEGEEPLYTGDGDDTGILTPADEGDAQEATTKKAPASPDDPRWGTSEFEPERPSVARRATLFDLPDPNQEASDQFDGLDRVSEEAPVYDADTTDFSIFEEGVRTTQDTVQAVPDAAARTERKRGIFFGRKKNQEQESMSEWLGVDEDFNAKKDGRKIGSWDNFDNDEDDWKGGATTDIRFRVVDGGDTNEDASAKADEEFSATDEELTAENQGMLEAGTENVFASELPSEDAAFSSAEQTTDEEFVDGEAPTSEELRDAILSMDNEALIAHDIWFVALGGSSLDHAGMDAFLAEYRAQCRGSFVINLDSIGAGQLTALTHEGVREPKRADRRILRLLNTTASALNINLGQSSHAWEETDATKAMRSSMRSVTLMGTNEAGVAALSHTADDVYENVDTHKINSVVELVCELIRRS